MPRSVPAHVITDDSALGGSVIERSIRFNRSDAPYLQATLGDGNEDKWTWSAWVKKTINGQHQNLFSSGSDAVYTHINFDNSDRIRFQNWHSAQKGTKITTRKIRDFTSWMHIVIIWDSGNATADDRMRIYVNGTRETTFDDSTNPDQNQDSVINGNSLGGSTYGNGKHFIGKFADTSDNSGTYQTEINFVDGQAYDPSYFGYTDFQTGIWRPKKYEGAYGGNGFYLPLDSAKIANDFLDESSSVNKITTGGEAVHSTEQTKNGASSIKFDGNGDKLTANNSDFVFGTSDFTVEAWVYKLDTGLGFIFGQTDNNAGGRSGVAFGYQSGALWLLQGDGSSWNVETTQGTFPRNEWVHIAVSRDYSETKTYYFINGSLVYTYTSNVNLPADNSGDISIGSINTAAYDWDGYIDQVRISNTARYTSNFTPPAAHFTSDANTKFLVQSDVVPPYATSDKSGNGNDFTANNISTTDSLKDTPTNNFCTLNAIQGVYSATGTNTYSEGNLKVVTPNSGTGNVFGNMSFTSGKWYAEAYVSAYSSLERFIVGASGGVIDTIRAAQNIGTNAGAIDVSYFGQTGVKNISGSESSYGDTYTVGDIIGVALDLDNRTINFYKNNTAQGTIPIASTGDWAMGTGDTSGGGGSTMVMNYGQDSSFAGAKTAQGNADGNGKGDFYYSPPSGFVSMCSANLPPTVPSVIRPQKHFAADIYTGTGSTLNRTNLEFVPDLVWLKRRDGTNDWSLTDSVRGATKTLVQNTGQAESTITDYVTAFLSNGYQLGDDNAVNGSSMSYLAWCWKAGGSSTVTNNDGNNTSQVSANTTAGFSILTYTGNGTNNSNITMGHGLGKKPGWIIIKNRSRSANWVTWIEGIGGSADDNQKNLDMNTNGAAGQNSSQFRYADASIIAVRDTDSNGNNKVNRNGDNYVAYCWSEIPGYSKFGNYTGNGNNDGPFIYCGFRPAWVTIKNTSNTNNWQTWDSARESSNEMQRILEINDESTTEGASSNTAIDFLSDGFKIRTSFTRSNSGGYTYAYMAFAEQPGSTPFETHPNAR